MVQPEQDNMETQIRRRLPALLPTGCAMLPDSPPIMTASVTSQALPAAKPTVSVTAGPNGRLSAEYSSPTDTLQKPTGVVSGEDPDRAEECRQVRVFRVESENSHKGACLPVRYDDNGAQ